MTAILRTFNFIVLFVGLLQPVWSEVELLRPEIISIYSHDVSSFTQGLAVYNGMLYESTGLYGKSSLRQLDLKSGKVIKQVSLPPEYFGEGIAIVDNQIIQLTWQENKAFVYDLKNLNLIKTLSYQGQGWGLCGDGKNVWMTNGTSSICQRSSVNFTSIRQCHIELNGRKIERLNDLECVGNFLYTNVWGKNIILRIDKESGQVTGIIDASGLLSPKEMLKAGEDGVLNGIAYNPSHQTFFITGKYWPWLFEVQFVPQTR